MAWKRHKFKDNKVFAEVDEMGNLVIDDGRVRICYKPGDDRTYLAAAANVFPLAATDGASEGSKAGKTGARGTGSSTDAASPRRSKASPRKSRSKKKSSAAAAEDAELAALASLPEGIEPIIVYTDGACRGNPGPAGLGAILSRGEKVREISEYLGPHSTNNIAELMAVKRALESIKQPELPIVLYTDSEYVLGVLTKNWKAKANTALIAELRALIKQYPELRMLKVAAHAGIPGNERADELGNLAIIKHHGERG